MKIEITPELLAELKDKAVNATWGDRKVIDSNKIATRANTLIAEVVIRPFGCGAEEMAKIDAEYIAAANPAVMLSMIEKIEILENDNNLLKQTIKDLLKH